MICLIVTNSVTFWKFSMFHSDLLLAKVLYFQPNFYGKVLFFLRILKTVLMSIRCNHNSPTIKDRF